MPEKRKPEESESKIFFVYLRQSKEWNSAHTFDVQLRTIEHFAHQRGFPINDKNAIIKQEDASAYEKTRKRFEEMMLELERDSEKEPEFRIYEGILFFNVSRLARNAEDFVRIEQLMKKGYKMLSATENIIDSPSGMYFFRMIQVESIYYSDRQSSKSQSYSLHILSENPRRAIWGKGATYGYYTKDGDIHIHPVNSLIVKRIFDLKKEEKGNETIASIIQQEFKANVDKYNRTLNPQELSIENQSNENESGEDAEDLSQLEEDEVLTDKKTKKPQQVKATIPNSKQVSDILSGRGSVQYDGRRRCKFELKFEEDIKLYNGFLSSKMFRFRFEKGDRFQKGKNILFLEVPELRIVSPELFKEMDGKKVSRERPENGHVYNGILYCGCGTEMRGKVEWKLGKVYYQCPEAMRKNGTCENSTRIEERHVHFHIQSYVFPHLWLFEGSEEFEEGLRFVKEARTEDLRNRLKTEFGALTKLKTGQKSAETVGLQEDYIQRIEDKQTTIKAIEQEIEDALEKAEADYLEYIREFEEFEKLPKSKQSKLASEVFVRLTMEEERTDEYRYNNPYNRKSIQYQKLASYELTPYYQALFDMNFPNDDQ